MKDYIDIIINKTVIIPKTILEIGSRDGHDSNELKKFFDISDKNVWVVEPNPNQNKKIQETYPKFNLIKEAIYSKNSVVEFNCVEDQEYIGVSSILDRKDKFYETVKSKKIKVNAITGSYLLNKINISIDLCKIDVEGLTYEVLLSFNNNISQIKSLHLECEHKEIWNGQKLFLDIERILKYNNFEMIYFKFVGSNTIQSDSIWVQKKYLK